VPIGEVGRVVVTTNEGLELVISNVLPLRVRRLLNRLKMFRVESVLS
jgi:hypothetical protein